MTLAQQLEESSAAMKANAPEEVKAAMMKFGKELTESGIADKILSVGEIFPEISLPDAQWNEVSIQELLKNWPAVISFYRGGWCPYCSLELKALEAILPEFKAQNVQLIAISPEVPDIASETAQANKLNFPVLSDAWNVLARKLQLTFRLTPEIIELYKGFGIDVEKHNGDDLFELPMPATYVVNTDGTIIFAEAMADYTKRTEPSDIIEVLKNM